MMAKPEELLADAYDEVKGDLVTALKNHPQYQQFLDTLAAKGIQELFALVATAA
jgi:hypothetical protein